MKACLFATFLVLCACTPGAKMSVEQAQTVSVSEVKLAAPTANARVTSPLEVSGVAPSTWYFEAVFAARLEGVDGTVLTEAPAQAQSDWTIAGPVKFVAKFDFKVATETRAMIVLEKDTTGENKMIKSVRIPVLLEPAG
jgi:Immunoglobulin-like domain of bacterial spore germination